MATIRVSRQSLSEVERALSQYEELLAALEQGRILKESTRKTYLVHSQNFVRWLSGEFDPGARNKS
jgi:hypothetical protein